MPLKTLHRRLREKIPERLKRLVPEELRPRKPAPKPTPGHLSEEGVWIPDEPAPAPAPPRQAPPGYLSEEGVWTPLPDPAFDPEAPPVETEPASGFDIGPKMKPSERMPLPEQARHPELEEQVMFNVGDPVELDADPTGRTGVQVVHAVHVSGPPARMPARPMTDEERADYVAGQVARNPYYPFRALQPGQVLVRNGSEGTVQAISGDSVVVRVPTHNVTIAPDALRKRELQLQERLAEHHGGYSFGFLKENVIPLKLEEERVWASKKPTLVAASDLLPRSVRVGYDDVHGGPSEGTWSASSRAVLGRRAGWRRRQRATVVAAEEVF